jgi:aldehyde dehydrogenase family 7 protein A1
MSAAVRCAPRSLVCGNVHLWKPAPSVSLTAVACNRIMVEALEMERAPSTAACLLVGGADVGRAMVSDPRIELLSFTGSTKVGRQVAVDVASRFGKTILELGGNNAMIIMDDANLVRAAAGGGYVVCVCGSVGLTPSRRGDRAPQELALRATLFSAVGTAGQRCTSLRRLLVHEKIFDKFMARLVASYRSVRAAAGARAMRGVRCAARRSANRGGQCAPPRAPTDPAAAAGDDDAGARREPARPQHALRPAAQ